jgi:hypothetical protein
MLSVTWSLAYACFKEYDFWNEHPDFGRWSTCSGLRLFSNGIVANSLLLLGRFLAVSAATDEGTWDDNTESNFVLTVFSCACAVAGFMACPVFSIVFFLAMLVVGGWWPYCWIPMALIAIGWYASKICAHVISQQQEKERAAGVRSALINYGTDAEGEFDPLFAMLPFVLFIVYIFVGVSLSGYALYGVLDSHDASYWGCLSEHWADRVSLAEFTQLKYIEFISLFP